MYDFVDITGTYIVYVSRHMSMLPTRTSLYYTKKSMKVQQFSTLNFRDTTTALSDVYNYEME